MNPAVPDLLGEVLQAAAQTLDRATGAPRRLDNLEQLYQQVTVAAEWPTDRPHRYVNRWTILFVAQLRAIERGINKDSDARDGVRAEVLARALLPMIQRDAREALDAKAAMLLERG